MLFILLHDDFEVEKWFFHQYFALQNSKSAYLLIFTYFIFTKCEKRNESQNCAKPTWVYFCQTDTEIKLSSFWIGRLSFAWFFGIIIYCYGNSRYACSLHKLMQFQPFALFSVGVIWSVRFNMICYLEYRRKHINSTVIWHFWPKSRFKKTANGSKRKMAKNAFAKDECASYSPSMYLEFHILRVQSAKE